MSIYVFLLHQVLLKQPLGKPKVSNGHVKIALQLPFGAGIRTQAVIKSLREKRHNCVFDKPSCPAVRPPAEWTAASCTFMQSKHAYYKTHKQQTYKDKTPS
ncbi:hypothetical protein XENOCAPTIV_009889 [Xenoophorus captivus]|uniref:Secreted protein n=1 Tax=Xenoophorus captivus TaxID=1517983 RepID=A0ABV0QS56_9TELE